MAGDAFAEVRGPSRSFSDGPVMAIISVVVAIVILLMILAVLVESIRENLAGAAGVTILLGAFSTLYFYLGWGLWVSVLGIIVGFCAVGVAVGLAELVIRPKPGILGPMFGMLALGLACAGGIWWLGAPF